MFTQNDWWLKQMAEQRINTQLQEAQARRLVKLATAGKQQGHWVQRTLGNLGKSLSRAGDYLQIHFGVGLQTETDHHPAASSFKRISADSSTQPRTKLPC